jgi:ABC-type Mn2+/Zn2+ transport system permease subunit
MDPVAMKGVVAGLADTLMRDLNLNVSSRAQDLESRLDSLNTEIANEVAAIPQQDRKLVTGHESMGYFAQRYGFTLVGAIIPSINSEAQVSAADLAALKTQIEETRVKAIFTEVGTNPSVAKQIGDETGVKVVELNAHILPADGSYFTFMRNVAGTITDGLNGQAYSPTSEKSGRDYGWFITPFSSNRFMLNALIAGILVAIACAVAGTFVVLRGMSFIGDALGHGVLPGIALAFLCGFSGILGAAIGAAFMIGGITLITHKSRLSTDTAIGLLFVGMLSLGVVIVSRSTSFSGDLTGMLFGEILGISLQTIWIQFAATVIIIITAIICARPFLLLSFDPEQAQVAGFSPRLYHNIMLVMIAVTVVASFQAVGTLLVFGLLIAPAGAGALLARRISAMMAWAIGFGVASIYLGLLISYHFSLAAGASIILVTVVIFFIVFVIQNMRNRHIFRPQVSGHEHH